MSNNGMKNANEKYAVLEKEIKELKFQNIKDKMKYDV